MKGRPVQTGVKVHAVTSNRGPPSVTVHVEIDPSKLKQEIGDFGAVREVVAEIPEHSRDWRPQRMHKDGREARDSGEPIEKYSMTHYGPSDSHERGVGVTIDTGAGSLSAQADGEAHSTSQGGQPDDSHLIPSPTRK